MRNALVLGGKLQGVEAAYLMKEAGWHVSLADKNPDAEASLLANQFFAVDLLEGDFLVREMRKADLVIPALEKIDILERIDKAAKETGAPLMFGMDAYRVSCSKKRSDKLFQELGIPVPKPWPECSFPVIVKPSGRSGSEGVRKIGNEKDLASFMEEHGDTDWVVQEYLDGSSYSIEIVARGGRMQTFQVTRLEMDEIYDCKRVICPSGLSAAQERAFGETAKILAEAVKLEGIMDVEAILSDGELKVLEIDARIPSQTPTAVYHATGILMPLVYADMEDASPPFRCRQSVLYEHVQVKDGTVWIGGEHLMGGHGPLHRARNFFGADEALTNYFSGCGEWAATLILCGSDEKACRDKHHQVMQSILESMALTGGERI